MESTSIISNPLLMLQRMVSNFSKFSKRKILRYLLAFVVVSFTLYNFHLPREAVVSLSNSWTSRSWRGRDQEHLATQQWSEHKVDSDYEPSGLSSGNASGPQQQYGQRKKAVIGKVTISFGERDKIFERAIRSHELHNEIMGYPQYVLRERLLSGLWSKHAYIFSVIVRELSKPEPERLKWIMYVPDDVEDPNTNS